MLYACDSEWWDMYHASIDFEGEKWTQDKAAAAQYGLNHVPGESSAGLGHDRVHFGSNGGYQAINLAYLFGAKRIILLGFDCKDIDDKAHWFGQHPDGLIQRQPYDLWLNKYPGLAHDLAAEGVEVINCSMDSAIEWFTKMKIEDVRP